MSLPWVRHLALGMALLGLSACTDGQETSAAEPAGTTTSTPPTVTTAGAEVTVSPAAQAAHEHAGHEHTPATHDHARPEHTTTDPDHADSGHEHHAGPPTTPATTGAAARLHQAYVSNRLVPETLAAFRELGADLEAVDGAAETLLIHAARRGDLAWVQALIEAGARLEHRDHHGWSALNHAINASQPEVALALLKAGAKADVADMHANSPLQYAVNLNADARVVAALVAAGADVNRLSQHGHSVLMEALDAGNVPEVIAHLLKAPGIKLDYVDREGMDARAHAEETGEPAVLALFPPAPGAVSAPPASNEAPAALP